MSPLIHPSVLYSCWFCLCFYDADIYNICAMMPTLTCTQTKQYSVIKKSPKHFVGYINSIYLILTQLGPDINADYYASMSTLFVNDRLDNFHVLRRKSIYNFLSRLKCSENVLMKNTTESQYFSASSFMREYAEGICENTVGLYMKLV